MRELMAVGELIDAVLARIAESVDGDLAVVRVRRGTTFSEEALRRGFDALGLGTRIEGARLEIEAVNRVIVCACGRCQTINDSDLVGPVWTCEVCGHTEEIDASDDLELIDVRLVHVGAAVAQAGNRR